MKTIYLCFLCALLFISASAQTVTISGTTSASGTWSTGAVSSGGGGGGSYIYQQDFESGVEPAGWSHVGTVAYNYATAPAPLRGSFSLGLASGANATYIYSSPISSDIYGFFEQADPNQNDTVLYVFDGSGNVAFYIDNGGGHIRINHGSANAFTSTIYSAPSVLYIWFHYLPASGGGGNGVAEVWVSTTTTKPANGSADYAGLTTGTSTFSSQWFRPTGPASGTTSVDYFRLSLSPIGSNP